MKLANNEPFLSTVGRGGARRPRPGGGVVIEMLVPARDPLCKYFLGFLMRLCSECGLDMDLVGLRHRCVPKPRAPVITEMITKPAREDNGKSDNGRQASWSAAAW